MYPKIFCHSILHLNRKEVKKLMKVSRKIQLIRKLRQKLRLFWLKKIYLLKKLKKLRSCLGRTQIRKNTLILSGLQESIFRHHHLLFILKGYFQKLVTCTNKSWIDCFQKPAKNFYFVITTWKYNNRFLCSLMVLIWVNVIY